jgi:hypothetical protein
MLLGGWQKYHNKTLHIISFSCAPIEQYFSVAGRILSQLAAGSTRGDNFEDMHFLRQKMKEFMDED